MNALVQPNGNAFALDFANMPDIMNYETAMPDSLAGGQAPRNEISLKNQYFTLKKADGTVLPSFNTPLQAVILMANPYQSRTYFPEGYSATGDNQPACSSTNGIAPNLYYTDDKLVQSGSGPTCAVCPHNVNGTGQQGKGKACGTSLTLTILPLNVGDNLPFSIRLPITAIINFNDYMKNLRTMLVAGNKLPATAKVAPVELFVTEMFFVPQDPKTGAMYPQPRLNFRCVAMAPFSQQQIKEMQINPEVKRLCYNDEESIAQQRTAADMMNRAPQQPVFNAPGAYQQPAQQPVYTPPYEAPAAPPAQPPVYTPPYEAPAAPPAQQPVVQPQATPAWGQPAGQAAVPVQQPQAAGMSAQDIIKARIAAAQASPSGDGFAG